MTPSHDLKIEGPSVRAKREDAGVTVEYLGVRVIIAPRYQNARDRGVWLIIQDGKGEEDVIELATDRNGITSLALSPFPIS